MLNRFSALAVMTVLLMASCTEEQVVDPQTSVADNRIQISSLSQNSFTRVSESNGDSLLRHGVEVFCHGSFIDDDSAHYFTDYVKFDGTSWKFQSSEPHMWPLPNVETNEIDSILDFYAFYPTNKSLYFNTFRTQKQNGTSIHVAQFYESIQDDCDFLVAILPNQTSRSNDEKIAMTFMHVMTEVELGLSLRSNLTNEFDNYRVEVDLEGTSYREFNLTDTCWTSNEKEEGWDGATSLYMYANPEGELTPLETNETTPTFLSVDTIKFIYPAKYKISVRCYGNILKEGEIFHTELVNTLVGDVDLSSYMGKKVTIHLTATMTGDGNRPLDSLETDNDDPVGTIDAPLIRVSEWE